MQVEDLLIGCDHSSSRRIPSNPEVKHDRGFLDPGSRSSAQDFGSPAVASIRKSPICSQLNPFAQPRQVDGPDVGMETSDIGGEDLRKDSDFEEVYFALVEVNMDETSYTF